MQRNEFDVRFFDPESTRMVAKLSFSESKLSSTEQEAFRNFSYVAPDAELFRYRRRGNIDLYFTFFSYSSFSCINLKQRI
jgi:hypothetical protein